MTIDEIKELMRKENSANIFMKKVKRANWPENKRASLMILNDVSLGDEIPTPEDLAATDWEIDTNQWTNTFEQILVDNEEKEERDD